ncbi:hypothetical protein GALL_449370 [mine drainage metagenome]|uniref:Uncharacterized protein n=1 Tax=mine drainage metagenome TaxID=410659 RepID=A0A1J5PPL4_9ZZZZ
MQVGIDQGVAEIRAVLQRDLIVQQAGLRIPAPRRHGRETLDDAGRIALQAGDFQPAEHIGRAGVEHQPERHLPRGRIDRGAAVGDARRGPASRQQRRQRLGLGGFPVGIAEHRAGLERPGAVQPGGEIGIGLAVGAVDPQIQAVDQRRLAWNDLDQHGGNRAAALDVYADLWREIALRFQQPPGLFRRLIGQAFDLVALQSGKIAPAQQVEVVGEQGAQAVGHVELHCVVRLCLSAGCVCRGVRCSGRLRVHRIRQGEVWPRGARQCQGTNTPCDVNERWADERRAGGWASGHVRIIPASECAGELRRISHALRLPPGVSTCRPMEPEAPISSAHRGFHATARCLPEWVRAEPAARRA